MGVQKENEEILRDGNTKHSKVALVKCTSYEEREVRDVLAKAVELLGGFEVIFAAGTQAVGETLLEGRPKMRLGCDVGNINKNSRLLLKPNLLNKCPPEKACTTHPAVFKATAQILQEAGFTNLTYGDSPGNPVIKPEKIAEECGLKKVADELGIPMGGFEHGTKINFTEGAACHDFVLCDGVLESDGIINICKMKTHQLERITGAVKNTFGCVYGVNKGAFHAKFTNAENFADMIADLNALVTPKLHIMDGIVAMEGNGPQSGTPTAMNVILVSTDPVALDTVFCHLVELKPELVPTNVSGQRRGIGTCDSTAISVITEDGAMTPEEAGKSFGNSDFDVQRDEAYHGKLQAAGIFAPYLEKKPTIKKNNCVGCGACVRSCPLPEKAISFAGAKIPVYNYSKCIKCWCCQEMCPEEAIIAKSSFLLRIVQKLGMA